MSLILLLVISENFYLQYVMVLGLIPLLVLYGLKLPSSFLSHYYTV